MQGEVLTGMEAILNNVTSIVGEVVATFTTLMADSNMQIIFGLGIVGTIFGLVGAAKNSVR